MNGEFDFIRRIRDRARAPDSTDIVLGIGDDAAVLREAAGRETLLTVDLLVEDVDFRAEYVVPELLGHKALAVSLSDIAAMGGRPAQSLLTLSIPKRFSTEPGAANFWDKFFEGYFALASRHAVALIGGDLSSAPDRLSIDSIVVGRCEAGKAIRRGGARPGERIYVTGAVGASAAGLKLLLGGSRLNSVAGGGLEHSALMAHLKPAPRVDFGAMVGELGLADSMIDLSDGLAQDLMHICEESGAGAVIDFERVPVAEETRLVAHTPEEAFTLAAGGGEDFELLLTAKPDNEARLMEVAARCGLRLTAIGEITDLADRPRLMLRRNGQVSPLAAAGYNHFRA